MALTQPFINRIRAFNANAGTTIIFGVLGGDIITSFTYSIYENSTGSVISLNSAGNTTQTINVSNDIQTESIRNFSFNIPSGLLSNNYTYKVQVYTSNGTQNSTPSTYQIFTCYVKPSFNINYFNGTYYTPLSSSNIVQSPTLQIKAFFSLNDNYSPAIFNKAVVKLYGNNNGNLIEVYKSDIIYQNPVENIINNFTPTEGDNSIYSSFVLAVEGETTDGMIFSTSINDIKCSYPQQSEETNIVAINNCDRGNITLSLKTLDKIDLGLTSITAFCSNSPNIYLFGKNAATQKTGFISYNDTTKSISPFVEVNVGTVNVNSISEVYLQDNKIYMLYTFGNLVPLTTQVVNYNLSNSTFGTPINISSNTRHFYVDSTNLYTILDFPANLEKYSLTSGEFINSLFLDTIGGSHSIVGDSNNIYIGGYSKVGIINKTTFSIDNTLIVPFEDDKDIYSLLLSNNSIFIGGPKNYASSLIKYNMSTSTFGAEIHSLNSVGLTSIYQDTQNVYANFENQLVVYNKNNDTYNAYSLPISTLKGESFVNNNMYFVSDNFIYKSISNSDGFAYLQIQYKPLQDTDWITFQTINNPIYSNFNFDFNYGGSNVVYEFRALFFNSQGVAIYSSSTSVLSFFNNTYICDNNKMYNITLENKLSNTVHSNQTAIYQPYGSEYYVMTKNAVFVANSGSINTVLLADTTKKSNSASIDRYAQVVLKNEFNVWLSNGKAKVIKDFNGNIRIIGITGDIESNYYSELGNAICSSNFSWVELGTFNQNYLSKLGMTNNFNIINSTL